MTYDSWFYFKLFDSHFVFSSLMSACVKAKPVPWLIYTLLHSVSYVVQAERMPNSWAKTRQVLPITEFINIYISICPIAPHRHPFEDSLKVESTVLYCVTARLSVRQTIQNNTTEFISVPFNLLRLFRLQWENSASSVIFRCSLS